MQKALATARAMHLIDDKWFLESVEGRGGKTKGTDAVADTLTKDDVIAWIRGIHTSGDASPAGVIAARGWENVLAKTSPEALLAALDAFARKVHLVCRRHRRHRRPLSSPPLDGFEGMPPVDLAAEIDPDGPVRQTRRAGGDRASASVTAGRDGERRRDRARHDAASSAAAAEVSRVTCCLSAACASCRRARPSPARGRAC